MTAAMLLRSLCSFLRDAVNQYAAAQGKSNTSRKPEVYDWWLPFKDRKRGDEEEKIDFPYIAARIVNGKDSAEDSQVMIELSFGVYSEATENDGKKHPDGAYDLLNLMEFVRQALFNVRVINNRFAIEKQYEWDIPEEQPYPLWVGRARTLWSVQTVIPQLKGDFLHG